MVSTIATGGNSTRRIAAFRTDASVRIGTGHVMRCLTLADEFRRSGYACVFICRLADGDLTREIVQRGHQVTTLPRIGSPLKNSDLSDVDTWLGVEFQRDAQETIRALVEFDSTPEWLVVDHYGIDARWERELAPFVGHIMVIDDLANRPHSCEVLLDQNLYQQMNQRYEHLIIDGCVTLLGPHYALLRDEFQQARSFLRPRTGEVQRLFVFFGGVDQANMTACALKGIAQLTDLNLSGDVVVGTGNPHLTEIEQLTERLNNFQLHVQSADIARLMSSADLSIGAGGTTTWERAYLGLPSISVVVAENQREMTDAAARAGACMNLGWYEQVIQDTIATAIREAVSSPQVMRKMSRQALAISAPEHQTGTSLVARVLMQKSKVVV